MPGVTSAPFTDTPPPSIAPSRNDVGLQHAETANRGHGPLEVERVLARHGVGPAADLMAVQIASAPLVR